MTSNHIIAVFVVLFVLSLTLGGHGQSADWGIYSSTADQFTVAVPPPVRLAKTAQSKNEADIDPERDSLNSYISVYEDTAAAEDEGKFTILVVNAKAKPLDSWPRPHLLIYLSIMLIGDDDEPHPTSVRIIKANGLTGKEYVWAQKARISEYGSTAEFFKRGRIFDQGDKIYVLVFDGESAAELKSRIAERFLNSFRLHNAKVQP